MRFKTTLKLFFQNLGLVWKVAVYKLISYSLTILLLILSARPVISILNKEGFFTAFIDIFNINSQTYSSFALSISDILDLFISIIQNNWDTLSISIILFIFVISFFSYFINALADIPVAEVLYGKMSCDAKFGFSSCFIRNFKKSLVYAVVKMFSAFIVDALILAILLGTFKLLIVAPLIVPFVVAIIAVLLLSFRQVIFACFAPNMVIYDISVFKSLAKSFSLGFKRFFYSFATAASIIICLFGLNVFLGIFTFGTGLILTIPTTVVILSIFNMVVYYSNTGMFFYIGTHDIQDQSKGVKKLEQLDTVKDLKFII